MPGLNDVTGLTMSDRSRIAEGTEMGQWGPLYPLIKKLRQGDGKVKNEDRAEYAKMMQQAGYDFDGAKWRKSGDAGMEVVTDGFLPTSMGGPQGASTVVGGAGPNAAAIGKSLLTSPESQGVPTEKTSLMNQAPPAAAEQQLVPAEQALKGKKGAAWEAAISQGLLSDGGDVFDPETKRKLTWNSRSKKWE